MNKTKLGLGLLILSLLTIDLQLAPSVGAAPSTSAVSWWARMAAFGNRTLRVTVTINKCIKPKLRVQQSYIDQYGKTWELNKDFVILGKDEVCYGTYYKDYQTSYPMASLKGGTIYFTVVPTFGNPR
jgi:hypothetical protein